MAHLGAADGKPAELLGDGRHFTGGNALDIHLGQRQLEGAFGAGAALQRLRVEAAALSIELTHLGDGDGDLSQVGIECFVLEAIGMAATLLSALVGSRTRVVLAFNLHSGVQKPLKERGQSLQTTGCELIQKSLIQKGRR